MPLVRVSNGGSAIIDYYTYSNLAYSVSITIPNDLLNATIVYVVTTETTQVELHPTLPSYDTVLYSSGQQSIGRGRIAIYCFDKIYAGTVSCYGYSSGNNKCRIVVSGTKA